MLEVIYFQKLQIFWHWSSKSFYSLETQCNWLKISYKLEYYKGCIEEKHYSHVIELTLPGGQVRTIWQAPGSCRCRSSKKISYQSKILTQIVLIYFSHFFAKCRQHIIADYIRETADDTKHSLLSLRLYYRDHFATTLLLCCDKKQWFSIRHPAIFLTQV